MHRFGLFFASVLLGTATLSGSPHRTPWGDPDLQGIWSNQTPTPLERPEALTGKHTLTEDEAAEFEKTSLDRLLTSISTFEAWTGTTAPHVVFGRVDKDRYARYHALHIADHFTDFAAAGS